MAGAATEAGSGARAVDKVPSRTGSSSGRTKSQEGRAAGAAGLSGMDELRAIGVVYQADALELGRRAQELGRRAVAMVQAGVDKFGERARNSAEELVDTLGQLGPVAAAVAAGPAVLDALVHSAFHLMAGWVGLVLGRWLFPLHLVLGPLVGLMVALVVAPAAWLAFGEGWGRMGGGLAEKERRLGLLGLAAGMGLLVGSGTRALPMPAAVPPGLTRLVSVVGLAAAAPSLGAVGDRRALLGGAVGLGLATELLAAGLAGGLAVGVLVCAVLHAAVLAGQLQILVAHSARPSPSLYLLSSAAPIASLTLNLIVHLISAGLTPLPSDQNPPLPNPTTA